MAPLYLVYTFLFLLTATASVYSFLRWRKKSEPSVAPTATSKDPVLPLFRFFKKHPRPSSPGGEKEGGGGGGGGGEGEEGIEAELIRLHNLPGFPRLLFTIQEETTEDIESNDSRSVRCDHHPSRSVRRSLRELLLFSSGATSSPSSSSSSPRILNPLSPTKMSNSIKINVGSTPPPKFKFLRDADEKMYMKTAIEAATKRHHYHRSKFDNEEEEEDRRGTMDVVNSFSSDDVE